MMTIYDKTCPICNSNLWFSEYENPEIGYKHSALTCPAEHYEVQTDHKHPSGSPRTEVVVGESVFEVGQTQEIDLAIAKLRCARVEEHLRALLEIEARIVDTEALAALTPRMVGSYLGQKGWQIWSCVEGALAIWFDDEPRYIHVPLDKNASDYHIHVRHVVEDLARVEERSSLAIYLDIVTGEVGEGEGQRLTDGHPAISAG